MTTSVGLFNPLPLALAHYQRELTETLAAAGLPALTLDAGGVEVGGVPHRVALAGAHHLRAVRRVRRRIAPTLVLWPAAGLLEPALWRGSRGDVWLIVHDAAPLRRQLGFGRLCNAVGRAGLRGRVRVIVHTDAAAQELLSRGWPRPVVLAHPVLTSARAGPPLARSGVRVLGQYKPARDLDILQATSAAPGPREIIGRGWPSVDGWSVRDAFVCEAEFDRLLAGSEVVVLPYRRLFQSGVAVRAVESLTPLVAPRHPSLEGLLGADWPGLVPPASPPGAWAEAVELVRRTDVGVLEGLRDRVRASVVEGWRRELSGLAA